MMYTELSEKAQAKARRDYWLGRGAWHRAHGISIEDCHECCLDQNEHINYYIDGSINTGEPPEKFNFEELNNLDNILIYILNEVDQEIREEFFDDIGITDQQFENLHTRIKEHLEYENQNND